MAGIPDLCNKVRQGSYDETYYDLDNTNKIDEIQKALLKTKQALESLNCKVVFITVTTISIQKWNNIRRLQGKTNQLKYYHLYEAMQTALNEIIQKVNRFIVDLNEKSHLHTPLVHKFVHKKNSYNTKLRYLYHKLVDGVHPNDTLANKWKDQISAAMKMNEQNMKVEYL